jgi:hypothetical protein
MRRWGKELQMQFVEILMTHFSFLHNKSENLILTFDGLTNLVIPVKTGIQN